MSLVESWLALVVTGDDKGAFLLSKFWKKFFRLVLSGAFGLVPILGGFDCGVFAWTLVFTDAFIPVGMSSCFNEGVEVLFRTICSLDRKSWSSMATTVSTSRCIGLRIDGLLITSENSLSDLIVVLFSSKMLIFPSLSHPDGLGKYKIQLITWNIGSLSK